ncbi:unnamed protein product, partial [Prorocentrum cordatum]
GARRPRQHAAGAAEARGGGRARELAARAPDAREGCAGAGAATAAPSRAHTAASAAAARGDGGAGRCAPRGGAVRAHTRGRPEGARLAPAAAGPRGLALGRPGARQAAGERARAALARAGRRAAGARAAAHEGRPGGPGHAPRGAGLGHGRLRTRRMHARGPLATPAGPRVPRESARARRSGRGPARPPPGARGGASARSCGAAAPRRACLRPPCRRWWCHVGAAGEAPAAKPGAPTGSPRCSLVRLFDEFIFEHRPPRASIFRGPLGSPSPQRGLTRITGRSLCRARQGAVAYDSTGPWRPGEGKLVGDDGGLDAKSLAALQQLTPVQLGALPCRVVVPPRCGVIRCLRSK